jgi:hypothetical protein
MNGALRLNFRSFGRLGSGWNVSATLERLSRAWGEAVVQPCPAEGPGSARVGGVSLGER